MTRAGPAKLIGMHDRGHLGVGAGADIAVYNEQSDREAMFSEPVYVFKDGELVVKAGKVIKVTWGATYTAKPEYDLSIEQDLKQYFDRYHTVQLANFKIDAAEISQDGRGSIIVSKRN